MTTSTLDELHDNSILTGLLVAFLLADGLSRNAIAAGFASCKQRGSTRSPEMMLTRLY